MSVWLFHEADSRLFGNGTSVQLTPKAAAVLGCLLRRKGETVTREDILAEVWPGLSVTKDLVREYVFDLRSAVGDDAREPRFIETIRGRGFRLIGPIEFAPQGQTQIAVAASIREVRPTVAVLKPDTFGAGMEWELFAVDLADNIITGLARFHDIGVVSRSSSFAIEKTGDLREAARRLNANYLLESSVVVMDDTARTRFQLVDGVSGRGLWAERYNHPLAGMAELSERLSAAVVNALTGWHGELHRSEHKIVTRKSTEDLNAFEHFIRGTDLEPKFEEASLRRSLDHLEKSLALDPTFARCWMVRSIMLQWAFDVFESRDPGLLRESGEALEKAYVLDPGDPVTLAFTSLKRCREGDINGAMFLLDRADASCGSDADACVCVATARAVLSGDHQRARELFDTALALNPTPPNWYHFAEARITFFAGDYERCLQCSNSAPKQVSALIFRSLSHIMLGEEDAARRAHAELVERYAQFDFEQFAAYFPIAHPAALERYREAVNRLRDVVEP